jgi:hypothetical protein
LAGGVVNYEAARDLGVVQDRAEYAKLEEAAREVAMRTGGAVGSVGDIVRAITRASSPVAPHWVLSACHGDHYHEYLPNGRLGPARRLNYRRSS